MGILVTAINNVKRGRSIEQFATDMGCSYYTARRWLRGETRPTSRAHIQFLVAEGVPEHLFARDGRRNGAGVAV